jgi:hypothetical protein
MYPDYETTATNASVCKTKWPQIRFDVREKGVRLLHTNFVLILLK